VVYNINLGGKMIITYRKVVNDTVTVYGFGFTGNRELFSIEVFNTKYNHIQVAVGLDAHRGPKFFGRIFQKLWSQSRFWELYDALLNRPAASKTACQRAL